MDITQHDIEEFKYIYKLRFGIALNDKAAKRLLVRLLEQMQLIYKPITANQFEELSEPNEASHEN